MMLFRRLLLCFLTLCLLICSALAAPRGRSLVIGNAAYQGALQLRNPVNDATDMAAALRDLGFEVTLLRDVTRRPMEDAIAAFGRPGQGGGVALFYFSGHGMQVQGQNHLLPLEARIDSEADVRFEAVPAEKVLAKMEEAGNRLNIVILDACRDNPYARQWRSTTKGLARLDGPIGSLVAYATAPGTVASDNPTGRNGMYTKHLLQQMRIPGLPLEELFRHVRVAVMQETDRQQVPWESSSLTEAFSFVEAPGATSPPPLPPAATTTSAGTQVAVGTYPPPEPPQPGKTFTNSIGMEFVLLPAGEFQMGAHDGHNDEKPVHTARISRAFHLGKYEVTQAQWEAVMGSNPSSFPGDRQRPVKKVSWQDVQEFIQRLNTREGGNKYRLPTEAEWEYAARAGTTTAYSFGNDARQLRAYAWYDANASGTTHPVGQLQPNGWGLYDMHGNVWEWVQDWYGPYAAGPAVDPAGPPSGADRVIRGGYWGNDAGNCRSALRYRATPGGRYGILGFRLLRMAP